MPESSVKDFEKNNTEKLDALKKKNFKVLHDYKNLPLSMEAEKIALICDDMPNSSAKAVTRTILKKQRPKLSNSYLTNQKKDFS